MQKTNVAKFVVSYVLRDFALSVVVFLTFLLAASLAGFCGDTDLVFAAVDLDCPLPCFFACTATTTTSQYSQ